jgi:hypothetical protein
MGQRRSTAIAAVVLLGSLLAGCAGSGGGPETGGSTVPSSSSSPSASGQPSLPPSWRALPPPTPSKTIGPGETTLSGNLEEGVEAGCVVLRVGDKLYNLLGADPTRLRARGGPVTVKGKVATGIMTTCQQGTPFQVSEVL